MDHKRILELAMETLEKRKTQVEAEIEALRAEMRGGVRVILKLKKKGEPTVSTQKKRRARTPAERKAQSKRMKAYWAAKKAAAKS